MVKKKLLGDRIESALKNIRADKAAKLIERATGKPCGCGKRKEKLNKAHREYLRRKAVLQAQKDGKP